MPAAEAGGSQSFTVRPKGQGVYVLLVAGQFDLDFQGLRVQHRDPAAWRQGANPFRDGQPGIISGEGRRNDLLWPLDRAPHWLGPAAERIPQLQRLTAVESANSDHGSVVRHRQ